MDKYLKAIEEAEKRLGMTHEATLKACKQTGLEYSWKDSKRLSNMAWQVLQGIKLVATFDDAVGMDSYNEIAEKCAAVFDVYERECDTLLKRELERL